MPTIGSRPLLTTAPAVASRVWLVLGGWPRKAAAVLLLAIAALLSVTGSHGSAATAASTSLVVARTKLAAGTVLTAAELRLTRWPNALAAPDSVRDPAMVIGKRLGAELAADEPVTRHRLLDTTISAALHAGQVAVSVQLLASSGSSIVQAGSRIDLYSSQPIGPGPTAAAMAPVATDVVVLAVLGDQADPPGTGASALGTTARPGNTTVVIACDQAGAARIAPNSTGSFLATLRPQT
jgi:pilus assembly protein CpaB